MAEFFERAVGGGGCCIEHFVVLDNLGICTSAGRSVGGWVGIEKCW